jgi:arginine N-succinyltransferase
MLVIRPVKLTDHEEILALARLAGIGMTSLPPDPHVLDTKIMRAVNSFAGKPEHPHDEAFLFVLMDTDTGRAIGTAGIVAHVGMRRPFYSYKLSTIVQASEVLGIYSQQRVLHVVNDYTGASEIGSLFVMPDYRRDGIGKFLSRSRYLMLAEFPQLFSETIISEIRGVQDAAGESPFYNHLARHFFTMDFRRSDFIYATQGGQFIADLMPRYPIYVNLLAQEAQAVIGVPLDASRPAMQMLEQEGFTHKGYIDIFDAGPTMQCELMQVRTVRESKRVPVAEIRPSVDAPFFMLANTVLAHFSVARAPLVVTPDGVVIDEATAHSLKVGLGDPVRYAS